MFKLTIVLKYLFNFNLVILSFLVVFIGWMISISVIYFREA